MRSSESGRISELGEELALLKRSAFELSYGRGVLFYFSPPCSAANEARHNHGPLNLYNSTTSALTVHLHNFAHFVCLNSSLGEYQQKFRAHYMKDEENKTQSPSEVPRTCREATAVLEASQEPGMWT